jgi:hypothetical protein
MSAAMKIAPTVQECMKERAWALLTLEGQAEIEREIRALLAVARAAQMVDRCARACWIDTAANLRATRANSRALARLQPKRARGRG